MPLNKRGEFAHSKATTILTAKFQDAELRQHTIFSSS